MFTRQEYMETSYKGGEAAHRRYYGQFVTPETISRVVSVIGRERILASTDRHMNDIPLNIWDRLVPMLPGSGKFREAGDYYTMANGVCLAKEAARQFKESVKS